MVRFSVKFAMVLAMAAAMFSSNVSEACGGHGCGGGRGFAFSLSIQTSGYRGYGGGYGYGGGCGGYGGCGGGYYGRRPWLFGGGAMAFRRSARLGYRSMRAAAWGFPVRSANLAARSGAAFNRGMYRAGMYY